MPTPIKYSDDLVRYLLVTDYPTSYYTAKFDIPSSSIYHIKNGRARKAIYKEVMANKSKQEYILKCLEPFEDVPTLTVDVEPVKRDNYNIIIRNPIVNLEELLHNHSPSVFYYHYISEKDETNLVQISFGDFLITLNLVTKGIAFSFNTYLKGHSINYNQFLGLLRQYKIF